MSQENIEIVRRFEQSWSRGELDAALECVHDEIEFDWSDSIGPFVGTYRGHDGFTRFWDELLDVWERFSPEAVEVIECGPHELITLDVVRARGKGSGIDMESRGAMLWTVRDGKIVRAKMFQTKEEAVQAAAEIPRENVDIVRRAYEAFARAGLDAMLEHFDPNAEYDITNAIGPFAGTYYGHAAIRNFLADYFESWEYVQMRPQEFIEVGEHNVVVPLRMQMRGRGSGVEVEAQTNNVWTLRDGKAVRMAVYNDRAEALQAAGVSD